MLSDKFLLSYYLMYATMQETGYSFSQAVDCIIGIIIKNKMHTIGPFIMVVCHAVCLLLSV